MNTPLGLTTLLLSVIAHVAPVSARPSAEEVEAAEIACATKVEASCLTTIALSQTERQQDLYLKALTNSVVVQPDTIQEVRVGPWYSSYKHLLLEGRWDEAAAAVANDGEELRIRQDRDGGFDESRFSIRDEVIVAQLLHGKIDMAIATARSANDTPGNIDTSGELIVDWLIDHGQMDEAVRQLRSLGRGLGTERSFREAALLKVALAYARAGETAKADRTVKLVRASPEVCRTQMLIALAVDQRGQHVTSANRLADLGRDALSSGEITTCLPFAFDGLLAVAAHGQAASLAQAALGTLELLPARDAPEYAMWSRIVTALRVGGRDTDAMALAQVVLRFDQRGLTGEDALRVALADYLRFYFAGFGPSEPGPDLVDAIMRTLSAMKDGGPRGIEVIKYIASITNVDQTRAFLSLYRPDVSYDVPFAPIYDELAAVRPDEVVRSLSQIEYLPLRTSLAKVAGLRLYRMGRTEDARRVLAESSAAARASEYISELAALAYLQRRMGFVADADKNLEFGYELARELEPRHPYTFDTPYFLLAQAALAEPYRPDRVP